VDNKLTPVNLQCVPYRARHLQLLNPDASEKMLEEAYIAQQVGPGYSAFLFGCVVGMAGLSLQVPGMGQAWALFTPVLKLFPVWLHRQCLEKLSRYKDLDIYAQAEGCNDKWMAALGFYQTTDDSWFEMREEARLYVRRKCG
jgi:hypothetical protein